MRSELSQTTTSGTLEEHIEQLNDRMRALEVKLEDTQPVEDMDIQEVDNQAVEDMDTEGFDTQSVEDMDTEDTQVDNSQPVENCCAPSVFVHWELVYEFPCKCMPCSSRCLPIHINTTSTVSLVV